MAFIVVYDANVLYPNVVRDLLIRIAQAGLVQAKWTETILDETFAALAATKPSVRPDRWKRVRGLMTHAIRDGMVVNYEPLLDVVMGLPDQGDRHVVAAAIRCKAQVIVTDNIRDFPNDALAIWNIESKTADEFVLDQINLDSRTVYSAVHQIADSWSNPPGTVEDVLRAMSRAGLVESAAALTSG